MEMPLFLYTANLSRIVFSFTIRNIPYFEKNYEKMHNFKRGHASLYYSKFSPFPTRKISPVV